MNIGKFKKSKINNNIMAKSSNVYKCLNFLLMNYQYIQDLEKQCIIECISLVFNFNKNEASYIYRLFVDKFVKGINTLDYKEKRLTGQNGAYMKHDKGILLVNKNGYLKFDNKRELSEFFFEFLIACDALNIN